MKEGECQVIDTLGGANGIGREFFKKGEEEIRYCLGS